MNYTKDQTTYFAKPKDDPKDRIELEVGDSKQNDFYPQVKIMRWDNEVNFSVRLIHDEKTPIVSTEADKILWKGDKVEAHFYDINNEEHPEGASEFEVILKEKPATNKVEFTLNTKGLEFFYQPTLTQKEIDEGASRPENVIGSYAVYASEQKTNWTGGKEYKCGKIGHIFRPKIIDSAGTEVWGDLHIENGILSVTIPQDFLDKAVYPVRHAAGLTFGYTTAGASFGATAANEVYGSGLNKTASASGVVNSITLTIARGGTPRNFKGLMILTNGTLLTNGITPAKSEDTAGKTTYTVNYSTSPSVTSGTDYNPAVTVDGSNNIYLDTGGASGDGFGQFAGYSYASPGNVTKTNLTNKYSIYATYTASGGDTIWTVALV